MDDNNSVKNAVLKVDIKSAKAALAAGETPNDSMYRSLDELYLTSILDNAAYDGNLKMVKLQ